MRVANFIVVIVAGLALAGPTLAQPRPTFDVLIKGGHVVDGTGNPWFVGDVGINADRIAAVGELPGATGKREIDATGLVVAPGFIDLHTHSDISLLDDGNAESKIRNGVTLEIQGEGTSVAPRDGLAPVTADGITQDWTTFTDYFSRVKASKASMNTASSVAYNQIRRVVLGYETRKATPAELERMKALAARSMREGAIGLVTIFEGGVSYPEEVIELAKVVRAYGGNYTSHIGSEGHRQDQELDLAFRIGREAKVPVHIFHFKARGPDVWPQQQHFIDRVNQARAEGLDVTANQYPYTAMNHGWNLAFPTWVMAGGPQAFAARLKDPKLHDKIKNDPDFKTFTTEHGGWDGIIYARPTLPAHLKYQGLSVRQIAALRGDADPADTVINVMAEAGGVVGGVFHNMSEDNVRLVMKQPWVAIASDGSAINLQARGLPHPRNYGTSSRVLGYYVRETKVLTLEDAVRKLSSLPAQIMGVSDRGQLHKGFVADVVVFDPATVKDTATFEKPHSYPVGIPYVLVNGVVVIDSGQHTGARPAGVVYGHGYEATP